MKLRFLLALVVIALLAGFTATTQAQYKDVTIMQLQTVSRDSLLRLDTLQSAAGAGTLDDTPYWKSNTLADTVRVTGIVTVAPNILTYTLARYNIYIQDTTTGQVFAGLNVLTNDTSSAAQLTGINALDSGYVVTIVGRVLEFGSQNNSLTEIYAYSTSAPVWTNPVPVNVIDVRNRPEPIEVTVDSFAVGTKPMPSRGEKYEGMYVIIRNVTVVSVDYSTGRFTFADASNNQMTMYDGSGWYTLRGHKLSGSRYTPPPVGTTLAYIRGVILPQSKTGTCGDYQIVPMYPGPQQKTGSTYPGDIKIDKFSPYISSLSRPQPPFTSSTTVPITFAVKDQNNGGIPPDSVFFDYKVGEFNKTWIRTKLSSPDTNFTFTIPAAAADSIVSYYVEAYAGGIYGVSPDPTLPKFYRVRNSGLSVYDVQYTPYVNGIPGFIGDTVTVSGRITSDTTDILQVISGRPNLWLAGKAGAWNGVAIWGAVAATGVDTLVHGDSVTITGVVFNSSSKTSIKVTSTPILVDRGGLAKVPGTTTISISGAGSVSYALNNPPVDGALTFEQWEGVLVQINNGYVVQRNADDATDGASSCFGEYFLGSTAVTTFGLRIDDDGRNPFYADTNAYYRNTRYAIDHQGVSGLTAKTTQLLKSQKISFLRGIMDFKNSNYKLQPRTSADYGTITSVLYEDPSALARTYELSQNYPNPFNPATTIRYAIPADGHVTMKVYNLLGQLVETLVDLDQTAGAYAVSFNASRLSTGVYFYELQSGDFRVVKKMLLLK